MEINKNLAYIAIKPKGFKYYIWFKTDNVSTINNQFIGKDGWGVNGVLTNIVCNESEIDSYISSEIAQY